MIRKFDIDPEHIHRDAELNGAKCPITEALNAQGYEVKVVSRLNYLPPKHDWQVVINGTAYRMTYDCRDYYHRFLMEHGFETKPAEIIIDNQKMTADIRIKRWISYSRYGRGVLGGYWK